MQIRNSGMLSESDIDTSIVFVIEIPLSILPILNGCIETQDAV